MQALADADRLVETSRQWSRTTLERQKAEVEQKRQNDARAADEAFETATAAAETRREHESKKVEDVFPARLRATAERTDAAIKAADETYPARLQEIQDRYQRESKELQVEYEQKKETTQRLHEQAWAALEGRWRDGLAGVGAIAQGVHASTSRRSSPSLARARS
jgi:hypothetical protein